VTGKVSSLSRPGW